MFSQSLITAAQRSTAIKLYKPILFCKWVGFYSSSLLTFIIPTEVRLWDLSYVLTLVVSCCGYSYSQFPQIVCEVLRTEDVLMSQQHRVIDFSFSEPGLLVPGGEDFDGDALSLPLAPPHFAITALT